MESYPFCSILIIHSVNIRSFYKCHSHLHAEVAHRILGIFLEISQELLYLYADSIGGSIVDENVVGETQSVIDGRDVGRKAEVGGLDVAIAMIDGDDDGLFRVNDGSGIDSHFGFDCLIHVRLLSGPCGRYGSVGSLSGKSKAGASEKNASASGRHKPAVQGIVPKHNSPRRAAAAGHGSSTTPGCCGLPSQRSG